MRFDAYLRTSLCLALGAVRMLDRNIELRLKPKENLTYFGDILPPASGVGFLCVHAITASRRGYVLSVNEIISFETFWQRLWRTCTRPLGTSLLARSIRPRSCLNILSTFMFIHLLRGSPSSHPQMEPSEEGVGFPVHCVK